MPSLLPELIDLAAARTPEQEAVRFNGLALTYSELSQQSDQLATLLIDQGVGRGDRVALLLGKGLQAAVAIYGVMKAGAAYVPLDVTAPPSRLAFILRRLWHSPSCDRARSPRKAEGRCWLRARPSRCVLGVRTPASWRSGACRGIQ